MKTKNLMNKTARLRVLNSEKEKAALALRNGRPLMPMIRGSSENNVSNLDSELLENHLEALEVEVEVEKAAVNDLQSTMTSDLKVGLADIYQALDDLEEGESQSIVTPMLLADGQAETGSAVNMNQN